MHRAARTIGTRPPMRITCLAFLLMVSVVIPNLGVAAAKRSIVAACTDQSGDAFAKIPATTDEADVDSAAKQFGFIEHDANNPLVAVDKLPSLETLDAQAFEDPSCALGEALQVCSTKDSPLGNTSYLQNVFCELIPRLGILVVHTAEAQQGALIVFRKVEGGWRVVQAVNLNFDASVELIGDDLQVVQSEGTSRRIFRWTSKGFAPIEERKVVFLWNGKVYRPITLDQNGEIPGATPDCSIAATREAINAIDKFRLNSHLEQVSEARFMLDAPIWHLRCKPLPGNGSEIQFSLADYPVVTNETWIYATKTEGRDWKLKYLTPQ